MIGLGVCVCVRVSTCFTNCCLKSDAILCGVKCYLNMTLQSISSEFTTPPADPTIAEVDATVRLISRDELDRRNEEESGSWLLVHGRVYDTHTLTKLGSCRAERLAEWVGRDAASHSQSTRELIDQCCVGTFREVGVVCEHACAYLTYMYTCTCIYTHAVYMYMCVYTHAVFRCIIWFLLLPEWHLCSHEHSAGRYGADPGHTSRSTGLLHGSRSSCFPLRRSV